MYTITWKSWLDVSNLCWVLMERLSQYFQIMKNMEGHRSSLTMYHKNKGLGLCIIGGSQILKGHILKCTSWNVQLN